MSFNEDGNEVLVPTVSDESKLLSTEEAIDLYRRTGKHLGKFSSPEAATAYAEKLHKDQEAQYAPQPSGIIPPMADIERFQPPEITGRKLPRGELTQMPKPAVDWTQPYEITKGFKGGLLGSNPKMFGDAMEATGILTDSTTLVETGKSISESAKKTSEAYKARVPSFTDIRGPSDAGAYAGYQIGSGVATSAPSLLAGGIATLITVNPFVGIAVGAIGPSYIQNFGDVYGSAKEDKDIAARVEKGELTPKQLAATAAIAAIPVAALDVVGLETVLGAGLSEAKRGLVRAVVKAIATGSISEGSTEGLQEVISQWAQHYLGSQSPMTEKIISVVDNLLGGALAGGTMAGGARVAGGKGAPAPAEQPAAQPHPAPDADISRQIPENSPAQAPTPPPAAAPQAPAPPAETPPAPAGSIPAETSAQPAIPAQIPPIDETAMLRAYGYTPEQIEAMSPEQRAAEYEDARAAHAEVAKTGPTPEKFPSATSATRTARPAPAQPR